jgi:N-acetylmuramoyl-L-alanine amidase
MRKIIVLVSILSVVLLLFPSIGLAATTAKLYLNGKPLTSSVPPAIVNNSTMVPFRVIAEHLGAKVTWEHQTKKVIVQSSKTIELKIADKKALVDGKAFDLQTAPLIMQGRTMIPLRFVGEQLGLKVHWDASSKSVYMEQPQAEEKPDPQQPEPAPEPSPSDPPVHADPGGDDRPDPGAEPTLIESISFSMDQIIVQGNKTPRAQGFVLTGPERIVLDFAGSAFAPVFNGQTLESGANTYGEIVLNGHPFIEKIRYSLFSAQPSTIRVVVDLKKKTGYEVKEIPDQNQTIITILTPGEQGSSDPGSNKYVVVIDAGHGGTDPGAISVRSRKEKDFTYAVARKVLQLLENEPMIESRESRSGDSTVELDSRVNFANQLGADVFVSIHGNKFTAESAQGTETYYSRPESKELADIIHRHVVQATQFTDRGVKRADFRVIKATTMPAVLIEVGFLSNPKEEEMMFDEQFQARVAAAIAAAIKEYLGIK